MEGGKAALADVTHSVFCHRQRIGRLVHMRLHGVAALGATFMAFSYTRPPGPRRRLGNRSGREIAERRVRAAPALKVI